MLRASLLAKLLLAILLPALATFAAFAVLGHVAAARALEAELGRRLAALASVTAAQISEDSVAILAEGDESSRTYRNLRRKLVEVRDAAGLARVYLFAVDGTARVDSGELPIGSRDYSLSTSQVELRQVFTASSAQAHAVSSVLFRGKDGALYKSGFAPIRPSDGNTPVRFALGVDGSAALYGDLLGLRKTLLGVGLLGAGLLVLLAVGLGLRITRPLRRLREDARLIGAGVLDQAVWQPGSGTAVARPGGDEVAELARALEAMRKALLIRDERLRMMLAGIAHEVRNPLGGMELFAGLLAEELAAGGEPGPSSSPPPDLSTARGYVGRVQRELRHLQAVVNDFLEYARRPRPQLGPVRIVELLQDVRDSAAALAPPQVTVELKRDPAAEATRPLRVHADANQLRRALLNLAHNAVQACAAPPADPDARVDSVHKTVEIEARSEPQTGAVTLWVRDDGPGIPAELRDKIWAPFFTTKAQGTGLGLAFVREIVEDHGGQIELMARDDRAGTCFRIWLPPAPAASSARSAAGLSGGPTDASTVADEPLRPNPP